MVNNKDCGVNGNNKVMVLKFINYNQYKIIKTIKNMEYVLLEMIKVVINKLHGNTSNYIIIKKYNQGICCKKIITV